MKRLKLSNTFFLIIALFTLVLSLGTGCGGSSSKSREGDPGYEPDDPPTYEPDLPGDDGPGTDVPAPH